MQSWFYRIVIKIKSQKFVIFDYVIEKANFWLYFYNPAEKNPVIYPYTSKN